MCIPASPAVYWTGLVMNVYTRPEFRRRGLATEVHS